MLRPPPSPRLALALACGLLAAATAAAESDLLLDLPESFGTVDAATFDVNRKRVGDAHLVMERIDGDGFGAYACALGGPSRQHLFLLESAVLGLPRSRGDGRIRVVTVDVPGAGLP